MKKYDFVQFSASLTPDHVAFLHSKKAEGVNMSFIIRQALDAYIANISNSQAQASYMLRKKSSHL